MAIAAACSIYNNLPDNTLKAAERSFLCSTVIATVLSFGNLNLGLQLAAVAYTASLIDALASAVLRTYFNLEHLKWYQNYFKLAVSLALNNFLCKGFLPQKIGIVFTMLSNFRDDLLQGLENYDLSRPRVVCNYRWVYVVSAVCSFFNFSENKFVNYFADFS